MQGLVKAPTRIKKFLPHGPISGPAVPDPTEKAAAPLAVIERRFLPMLKPEGFDRLAHDARNVLSALKLYCELLAEPGVLTDNNSHYAQELEAISDTASKLVERLAAPRRVLLEPTGKRAVRRPCGQEVDRNPAEANAIKAADPSRSWPAEGIDDLGRELLDMRPLLAGIAGPRVHLEVATMPCGGRSRLSKEDFTRVMLNLVRNAAEAMSDCGRLRITAQYGKGLSFLDPGQIPDSCPRTVIIAVEDSGPGIAQELQGEIFIPGFTTRQGAAGWPGRVHRGLGLTIVRDLVEAAGGTARVCSVSGRGARFELELPITSGMCGITNSSR